MTKMREHFTEHFPSDKHGGDTEAKRARAERVKALRAQGYEVRTEKWDFTDLARCRDYTLTAMKVTR